MSNQEIENKLKEHLKSWDNDLPPSVAGKLRAARYDALRVERKSQNTRWLVGTAAASLVCIALLLPKLLNTGATDPDRSAGAIDAMANLNAVDLGVLTAGEELEMLENIDFILWLAEQDDADLG